MRNRLLVVDLDRERAGINADRLTRVDIERTADAEGKVAARRIDPIAYKAAGTGIAADIR
jgi:hypothetical protein